MDTVLTNKVLDKLDTEFVVNLQKYRQFSECSTVKMTEEVYNFDTIKQRHRRHVLICVRLTFSEFYVENKQQRGSVAMMLIKKKKKEKKPCKKIVSRICTLEYLIVLGFV